jgi:activator of 2-hydroxyglutaryl-CoA dehydratase
MYYLGVDVGSVSTDLVLADQNMKVVEKLYLRTKGRPIQAIQEGFRQLKDKYGKEEIAAAGTTGNGRQIAATLIGADAVKTRLQPTQ